MHAAERRRARGMSLVEVLVSMVVVSIGALSATSLQMVTKRTNRDAAQRLEATHLASSLAERMRANNSPTALQAYAGLGEYRADVQRPIGGGALSQLLGLDCAADAASCCLDGDASCSGDQVAAVELWQLEQVMDGAMEQIDGAELGGLEAPTACIDAPATPGSEGFYTITIAFRGTLAIAEDLSVPCGHDATDASGAKLYGANNEFRRTLTVSAYIAPTVEK